LTVPKVKDLVATTDEKYNDILSVINNDEDNSASKLTDNINTDEMKNELKDYIKNISVNNQMLNDTTNII
jgi:hypothetical protein